MSSPNSGITIGIPSFCKQEVMVPVNSSTSLQSSSKNTIGFHITIYFFNGSIYIDCFTFLTLSIYIYFLFNPYLRFTYRSTNILLLCLKVHQGILFLPWFLRLMNVADTVILCIPDDAVCKLWGVYKGPTNVMIHTEDGREFNVSLSGAKGKLFLFHGWSNVVEHLSLTKGCLVVFNPISSTTFKLTSYVDGVSRGSFWTYLLPPSSHFYVIPESILPKVDQYSSNDVISTVMLGNKIFKVAIETSDGKVGFTVGFDVMVSMLHLKVDCILLITKGFGNFFLLKVFGENGLEVDFSDIDIEVPEVAPIDAENEGEVQIHGSVRRFRRMAGERYFRIPDPVSRMARLHEGLKDITVRLMHLDPPKQFTNGTRREKKTGGGWRYALTGWKKFMKAARINVLDTVHYSFDENEQVLSVERVEPYDSRTN
ncbi:putative transcription factor B3-Domain family [Helianthus annuus]|nr:putative transcription factor B3-Domain family [Helianthus annuus]